MLIDVMPKIRTSLKTVGNNSISGYNLELPDRDGFLYALLCEDRETLCAMLDYKGTQYTLFKNNYIGLAENANLDQYFRKQLLRATQDALSIMYQ